MQKSAVTLAGLTKRFGALTAVDAIDLDIRPGEVVALLGPNGAGKSTTIDLALGLSVPTAGTVAVFGGDPRAAIVAGRVGAMLQGGALLPGLTVAQSVALVAAAHRRPLPVTEALKRARCTEFARQKVARLSGGQTQRARFAVAIVSDPDLLFLDEPTAAMDVESRREFWRSMKEFTDTGRTVVFATHYLDEADAWADRIVMMRAGTVIADGTPAEIKAVVSGRRIRARILGAWDADASAWLEALPTVRDVQFRGGTVTLWAEDSDRALRALLAGRPDACDIEVTAHSMDDAFLALTSAAAPEDATPAPSTRRTQGAPA